MNPAWLALIIPAEALIFLGLGFVFGLWSQPGDTPDLYGSPEDPFRNFPE